jgi:hypothetical protein
MKPVYVRQNPTLPSHIHEEKGKALCGDKARPAIYIYMIWYQRLNRLSDLHAIRFRNSLRETFF